MIHYDSYICLKSVGCLTGFPNIVKNKQSWPKSVPGRWWMNSKWGEHFEITQAQHIQAWQHYTRLSQLLETWQKAHRQVSSRQENIFAMQKCQKFLYFCFAIKPTIKYVWYQDCFCSCSVFCFTWPVPLTKKKKSVPARCCQAKTSQCTTNTTQDHWQYEK